LEDPDSGVLLFNEATGRFQQRVTSRFLVSEIASIKYHNGDFWILNPAAGDVIALDPTSSKIVIRIGGSSADLAGNGL
jgi:hypothetical protein